MRPTARAISQFAFVPFGAILAFAASAQSPPQYSVTRTVALGAPDRWDYVTVDAPSHRVFIAHGDRITVVDGRDGAAVGEIRGFTGGTHGIAISHATGRGYTDDGGAGEAGSFNLETLTPIRRIKAAEDADAMTIDPKSGHVFVVNGDTGTVTVIDPVADSAIATVNVGGKLESAVADSGKLFVNNAGRNEIDRIDTATNLVDARWPVSSCSKPHGLAMDTATHRLFSSCVNSVLVVVDSESGRLVGSVPIGLGTDAAAFDPKRRLIFSSNGADGTLSVIQEKDAQTFVALDSVHTARSARTMGLDPDTGRIYLVAGEVAETSSNAGHKSIVPGSLKLLFLDPSN
jgi:YVTN family beta-propeller protein